jgi:hypothetical protein
MLSYLLTRDKVMFRVLPICDLSFMLEPENYVEISPPWNGVLKIFPSITSRDWLMTDSLTLCDWSIILGAEEESSFMSANGKD